MEYVLRIDVSDALSVESLEKARKYRRMARLVTDALAHYVRTKEGKASIELLTKGSARSASTNSRAGAKRLPPSNKESPKHPIPETVTIGDFLRISSVNEV